MNHSSVDYKLQLANMNDLSHHGIKLEVFASDSFNHFSFEFKIRKLKQLEGAEFNVVKT